MVIHFCVAHIQYDKSVPLCAEIIASFLSLQLRSLGTALRCCMLLSYFTVGKDGERGISMWCLFLWLSI